MNKNISPKSYASVPSNPSQKRVPVLKICLHITGALRRHMIIPCKDQYVAHS
jgi:hypothetical protein